MYLKIFNNFARLNEKNIFSPERPLAQTENPPKIKKVLDKLRTKEV